MASLRKYIQGILINSQQSYGSHPKLVKKMVNVYLMSDFDEFLHIFTDLMKYVLIHGEKEPVVEKSLSFMSKFFTSVKTENEEIVETEEEADDVDPLLVGIFNFLLKNHEANEKSVRYRICYLINKLLNDMGEQATIDDSLYNTIYDTMLQRLLDKVPAVRVQAILALARLQDPSSKECPVIKAYRYHMSMDPNSDVRKAVLGNIAITFQTLPDVLERTRDVKDIVRRQAYSVLAQKVHIRSFTIAQRVSLISDGLKDRSPSVQQIVKKNLLQTWLRLVDGKILNLLTSLDVETSTESAENAIFCLFDEVPYGNIKQNFDLLDDNKVISYEKLSPESALYWKCLAEHFMKEKSDEYMDEILPNLSSYCEYIQQYVNYEESNETNGENKEEVTLMMLRKEFILQQLLSIASFYDLSDEVGRSNLISLTRSLLLNEIIGVSCLPNICNLFNMLHPIESRLPIIAEIISDLREPLQTQKAVEVIKEKISEDDLRKIKLKLRQISVKILERRDETETCIRNLDIEKATQLKAELQELEEEYKSLQESGQSSVMEEEIIEAEEEEKEDSPATLVRCLSILCHILSSSQINTLSAHLRSLHDNLILRCLRFEEPLVRKYAVQSLAEVCLVSSELAKQHILLFIQISQIDIEEIQIMALKSIFDFLHLYGLEEFDTAVEDIDELPSVDVSSSEDAHSSQPTVAIGTMIANISKMLDSDSKEVRFIVAEGICKLLQSGRIRSSKLFSRLIILWYNPVTETDNMLRHMLGVFFPLYGANGRADVICESFIPTLHIIFNSPRRSPIFEIDVDDVCNFMVSITNPTIVCSKDKDEINVHDRLVFSICSEIIAYPERIHVKSLVRTLNHLSLTPDNFTTLRQVAALCEKMSQKIVEKGIISGIDRFHQSVRKMLKEAPSEIKSEPEDEEEEKINDITKEVSDLTILPSIMPRKRTLYTSQIEGMQLSQLISSEDESVFSNDEEKSPKKVKPESNIETLEIPQILISPSERNDDENKVKEDLFVGPSDETSVIEETSSTNSKEPSEDFEEKSNKKKSPRSSSKQFNDSSDDDGLKSPKKKSKKNGDVSDDEKDTFSSSEDEFISTASVRSTRSRKRPKSGSCGASPALRKRRKNSSSADSPVFSAKKNAVAVKIRRLSTRTLGRYATNQSSSSSNSNRKESLSAKRRRISTQASERSANESESQQSSSRKRTERKKLSPVNTEKSTAYKSTQRKVTRYSGSSDLFASSESNHGTDTPTTPSDSQSSSRVTRRSSVRSSRTSSQSSINSLSTRKSSRTIKTPKPSSSVDASTEDSTRRSTRKRN